MVIDSCNSNWFYFYVYAPIPLCVMILIQKPKKTFSIVLNGFLYYLPGGYESSIINCHNLIIKTKLNYKKVFDVNFTSLLFRKFKFVYSSKKIVFKYYHE